MPQIFGDKELTTDQVLMVLDREFAAITTAQARGTLEPLAFVCSITGSTVEWGLATLPRNGSGSAHSTENERMLLHQLLGTVNALADIY